MNTSLRETSLQFRSQNKGLAHFNITDSNQLKALAGAARDTGLPLIVGLSEGEREYFPLRHARALVDQYRAEGVDLYLNADHTYSVEKVKEAIEAGVDSVVVDGAKLSFDDNVAMLTASVALAKAAQRDILIEGEHGYIGSSSNIMDALPEGAAATEELMTKPDELKKLVEASGLDMVAPAVGNIHGMIRGGQPKLSITRIAALAAAVPETPLVLHGGSGSSDEEFVASVKAGITIIHINTELRALYRDQLEKSIAEHHGEVAPYKFLGPVVETMRAYAAQRQRLFASQ